MIEVKFFGTARLNLNLKSITLEADTVSTMLKLIAEKAGVPMSGVKNYLVYVNEINIDKLKRFRTPLKDGDKVMILSPSSGG